MQSHVRKPSRKLSFEDAIQIWIRVWQGEFQHRIAADYDVNPGRVSDVVKGRKHLGSESEARKIFKHCA